MTTSPNVSEMIERARRAQQHRLDAVQRLAEARQAALDVRAETARELQELQATIAERVGAADRDDVRAWNAALKAGWGESELRGIGFAEPAKKARSRQRHASKPAASTSRSSAPAVPSGPIVSDDPGSVVESPPQPS